MGRGLGSSPEPPFPPLPPWWHLSGWKPVHLAVLGVCAMVLLGTVIVELDVMEWRRHHLPEAVYETFQYPCQATSQKLSVYCWSHLPLDVRVEDLLSRLTDEEKVGLLTNTALGVPRLAIPPYQWWNEALHGVAISPGVVFAAPTPWATSFPQVIGTSSSFNVTLWHALGGAISLEARAFNNAGHAGLTFWTPNLNIFRDPRWGRGQETPGEDPKVTGDYVAAYVRGLQGSPPLSQPGAPPSDPTPPARLALSACCKHFDAYSLENWEGTDRYHFDAIVGPQDLADTYLPAFRACVTQGQASCLMCAYNSVNGVPMCANAPFLNGLARGAWGFEGYVTSDCDAVENVWDTHNYTASIEEADGAVLAAGTDLDCGNAMSAPILQLALLERKVTHRQVTTALARLFAVQFRLGMFDPPDKQPLRHLRADVIGRPAHAQLALEAARQSIVLLKNSDSTLPLRRSAALAPSKRGRGLFAAAAAAWAGAAPVVAVLGPHGNASDAMQGNYFGTAPFLRTPLDGVKSYAPGALYAPGCMDVLCPNATGFPDALAIAAKADVLLLFVGLSLAVEAEGMDRMNLTLPGLQSELVYAALDAARSGATVVLVILSGGGVDVSDLAADPRVDALLWAGYPGQSGGDAIAQILWGVHSPSGRLTQSWYPASFAPRVSMLDMGMRPSSASANPGRGYRFYNSTAEAQLPAPPAPLVFPFGAGLTYSVFNVSWAAGAPSTASLQVELTQLVRMLPTLRIDSPTPTVLAETLSLGQLSVVNTGPHASSRTLLAFLAPPAEAVSGWGAPQTSLVWYGKTDVLRPGEGAVLDVSVGLDKLSFTSAEGSPATAAGVWTLSIDEDLSVGVEVVGGAAGGSIVAAPIASAGPASKIFAQANAAVGGGGAASAR